MKIDNWPPPEQQIKHTHVLSFSLWNVQFWPQLDRVLRAWWSVSVCFGSVCDIGFYQLLRLTICFQPLPLRNSESESKYKLLYECLRLLPHFRCLACSPEIFFSTCVRGKHRPKRNNLRMKAQSFKKSETWTNHPPQFIISLEWTNRFVIFSALQCLALNSR